MSRSLPTTPLRFALFSTRPFWPFATWAVIGVTIACALDGAINLLLKNMIDAITAAYTGNGDYSAAWKWVIVYTAVFTAAGLCWRSTGFTAMQWFTRMKARAYDTLFAYLTHHSAQYFSDRFAGALTARVANVSEGIQNVLMSLLWQFWPLFLLVCVGFYTASTANPVFTLILGVWVFTYLTINTLIVLKKRKHAAAVATSASALRGAMVDSATNISAVHQGGMQDYEIQHLHGFTDTYRTATVRNWLYSEFMLVAGNILQMIFVGSMFSAAIILLQKHLITVGDVALISALMLQLIRQIFAIGNEMNRFMDEYGSATEGLRELLIPHEIKDKAGALSLDVTAGRIDFKDVHFSYGKEEVFNGFQLLIPAGQKVGVVGHSGAGKTSLTAILLRQYELQGGDILIDGQSIRDITQQSLRQSIAIVPQDTSLFHRTIKDNIRYGRLDATDEEVMEAAKLAQADVFISKLPLAYDTQVGERGVKLSGGQRQRIAVARAILKNAPILVLDEATSALDSESEACIQSALEKLMEKKTVLAIAHRLSTLRKMDRIIVLENGVIAEDGTHAELLEQKGIYAKLWESQVGGFIQE